MSLVDHDGLEIAVVTVPEAARILGIGRVSAYRAVARGELPALRFGRRVVVPKALLDGILRKPNACARKRERALKPFSRRKGQAR